MSTINSVKPALISGVRDTLPEEAIMLRDITSTIQKTYESFGFVPLETPCLEKWSVLTNNNPSFNKSIYKAKVVRGAEDNNIDASELGDSDTALRFDLTVPLARVVAAHPQLPRPFKRYQIGRVFRGERPQSGRFREFTQFDFDIIGANSIMADIEIIQIMYATMKNLGFSDFVIRINTRKILNGLAQHVECASRANDLLRIIDKFDKIGYDKVRQELMRKPENQFDESALSLNKNETDKVMSFLNVTGNNTDELLNQLEKFVSLLNNDEAKMGLADIQTIVDSLRSLHIPEKNWALDLSVARGLDYYTGTVFETVLPNMKGLGSVFSGGRFDGLMDRFVPGSKIPGIGASVGVDRVLMALQNLDLLKKRNTTTQVLITVFSPEKIKKSLLLANRFREAGINTELYMGEDTSLRGQISYAARQKIPYAVIVGPEEEEKGLAQLKDMYKRKQNVLSIENCIDAITNTF